LEFYHQTKWKIDGNRNQGQFGFFPSLPGFENFRIFREANIDFTWKRKSFQYEFPPLLSRDLVFCFAFGDPVGRFELAPPSLLLQWGMTFSSLYRDWFLMPRNWERIYILLVIAVVWYVFTLLYFHFLSLPAGVYDYRELRSAAFN